MKFTATLEIIGVNPFVYVPEHILTEIFRQAGKNKGTIPIKGFVNDKPYTQTLVRYAGAWRLYINTIMLKDSPKRVGERIEISAEYDPKDRTLPMPESLQTALKSNPEAETVFKALSPSRQQEIIRYITRLKSEESVQRNIEKALRFLRGEERFVGREKP